MQISKQSSDSTIACLEKSQPLKAAQYLIAPFKIYILSYLLSELIEGRKQQCLQSIRRSSLHLSLLASRHGKRKSHKVRTQWEVQPSSRVKQESLFLEESSEMVPIYHRQYQYLPGRKGIDGYHQKGDGGDYLESRNLYSRDYLQGSTNQTLTNQKGYYGQYQYASPYQKKRNTAFLDHGRHEDKGIVLKDMRGENPSNRSKQEKKRKQKIRSSKIINLITRGIINQSLSFSFTRVTLLATAKKYQARYNDSLKNRRQAQAQTDEYLEDKFAKVGNKQSQQALLTQQLCRLSTIFVKLNAIYRYLISVSFSKLKRTSMIEISNPKKGNAIEEEPTQPENRCVPIDSSASDEEEVTIKYIDDEGISANSTLLTSMSVLSFGEGGSSEAPVSQRSRETDGTLGLD